MKVTVLPPHESEVSIPSIERNQSFPSSEVYIVTQIHLKKKGHKIYLYYIKQAETQSNLSTTMYVLNPLVHQ